MTNNTITIEDVIKVSKEITKHAPKQQSNPFDYGPMQFSRMPVYELQDRIEPKVKVNEWFANKWLTDESKEKINAKLVEMLGVRTIRTIPKDTILMFGNNIITRRQEITNILNICA